MRLGCLCALLGVQNVGRLLQAGCPSLGPRPAPTLELAPLLTGQTPAWPGPWAPPRHPGIRLPPLSGCLNCMPCPHRRPEAGLGASAGAAGLLLAQLRGFRQQPERRRQMYVLCAMCSCFAGLMPNAMTAVLLVLELGGWGGRAAGCVVAVGGLGEWEGGWQGGMPPTCRSSSADAGKCTRVAGVCCAVDGMAWSVPITGFSWLLCPPRSPPRGAGPLPPFSCWSTDEPATLL